MEIEQNIANARSSLLKGTGAFLLVLVLYFLSSGFAFVSVYRWPSVAPTRFYSVFYWPLDGLARVSRPFRDLYNSYHFLCYRTFVQQSVDESKSLRELTRITDSVMPNKFLAVARENVGRTRREGFHGTSVRKVGPSKQNSEFNEGLERKRGRGAAVLLLVEQVLVGSWPNKSDYNREMPEKWAFHTVSRWSGCPPRARAPLTS